MPLTKTLVLAFPDSKTQARQLANELTLVYQEIKLHRFPDGESKLTLPASLPEHVIFFCSLDHPNSKLVELLLASQTARKQGCKQLTLIAPYLCYMRQDKAFAAGEVISQRIIGQFLAQLFDSVITVDTHLHRVHSLDEAIPAIHSLNLTAAPLLGDFLIKENLQPLLLGPDSESRQWVSQIAEIGNFDYAIAEKQRFGDRHVTIKLPDIDFSNRTVVIVDDVISSGYTIAEAAEKVLAAGAIDVHCLITHPLFAEGAVNLLKSSGIQHIWSSDSITHSSNVVSLAPLLACTIKDLFAS